MPSPAKACFSNPILFHHRGVPVRRYNKIEFRVNTTEFLKIIDAKADFGLSERDVIAISGAPCSCCKNVDVVKYDDKENKIIIQRGILNPDR